MVTWSVSVHHCIVQAFNNAKCRKEQSNIRSCELVEDDDV